MRAGSVGSPENPAAEVDLGALTDGQTGHGLPRRRQRGAEAAPLTTYRDQDDAAAAPSIPLAPRADALAGAAGVPVEGGWAPDVVEAQPLAVRRRADDDAPEAPLPSRAPAAADTTSVLPTRTPATPDLPVRASALPVREPGLPVRESGLPVRDPAGASRAGDGPSEATAPAAPPESRTSMFSGFRSRRAELAAAAVDQLPDRVDEQPAGDGADRLAAAATGFGGGWGEGGDAPAEPVPLVIPALEDDDVPPSLLGAVEERPSGRHALRVEEPAWQPVEPEPVEPAWSAHAFEVPALEVSDDDAWSPSPAEADHELWAPQVEASEGAPGEHVPSEQWQVPTWEEDPAPTASWPSPEQPVAVEQPAAEQWDDDAAWSAPTTPALAEVEPVWAPQPTAEAEPVWAPQPTAEAEPVWAPQPTAEVEPAWAPQPTAQVEPAWAPQPTVAAEPAPPVPATPWSRVGEPAGGPVGLPGAPDDAVVAVEPTSKRRWWSFGRGARSHAPAVGTPAAPVVEAVAAPSWSADPVVEPAPAAPTAPVRASAWGSPEPGAHARTPVEPVAPATPGSGATAFFPSVHATRDAQGVAGAPSAVEPVAEPQVEHGWQVPSPRPAPPQPAAPAAPATGAWAPQSWDGPEVPQWGQAASTGQGAGAGAPAAAEAPPTAVSPEPAPTTFTPEPGPTTFTPEPGSFDAEVNTMLAQRADLAQQALAELSQLSAYRPQAVTGGTGSLTRRTPTAVPAAPEIATASGGPRPERDANQVRSLLSSFQSGTSRGRMAVDGAQTTGTGSPGAGHEEGPSGAEGEPVAAVVPTDSDLTQRGTSW
ncbi:MAG: hypothetical protein H5T83_09045 [Actinotalea sp.]|nr:hypothetical protein [Actinotalea sp.]